jgi:hypothetical protein
MTSSEYPRRSRTVNKNLGNRPAPREAAPTAVDGDVVNGLRERAHEQGDSRHRYRALCEDFATAGSVPSYRKLIFRTEACKAGRNMRRFRHTGRPSQLNRGETDKAKLTRDTTLVHYENDLPSM